MSAPRTGARSSAPIAFLQICSLTSLRTASHVHFIASLRESTVGVLGPILEHVDREMEPDGECVPWLSRPRLGALATCSRSLAALVREVLLRELRFVLRDDSAVTLSRPWHRRFQLFARPYYNKPTALQRTAIARLTWLRRERDKYLNWFVDLLQSSKP